MNLSIFKSIRTALSVAFLAVSLLTLLLATCLQLYFSYQTQKTIIAGQQQLIAQGATSAVRNFIEEKQRVLRQAANLNGLATSQERTDLVLHKLLGQDPSFRELFLLDLNGTEIARISRLSMLTRDPLAVPNQDMLQLIRENKPYISPVFIDDVTSEPLVLIAIPNADVFNEVQGAFVAEVNLKFMWELVASIRVGTDGEAYVVDSSGNLIAANDISRVLQRENVARLAEVAQFIAGNHEHGIDVVRGLEGEQVIARHQALGTPDWAVVVELPVREAYAPLLREFIFAGLIVLVSITFALIIGTYFARRITHAIVLLNDAADKISTGALDTQIVVSSFNKDNEIGHLANSFNRMAAMLRELYAGLDAKIRDKTTQLSEKVGEIEKSRLAILNLLEDIDREKNTAEQLVVARTKELSDEKARLLASINSLSFGFLIVDNQNTILIKNPALRKILEIVEEPTTLTDISKYFEGIDLVASCKECIEQNMVVEHKDVSYGKKFLRVFCAPVIEGVVVIGNVVLVEDVTEAKVMERSRDEFFAVASHELRTPLTAIRGNADMILEMYGDKVVDKDMKEMLVDINNSSVRLIAVVNDFLEVSRLEQGRIEVKKEQFDVAEVAAKVVRDLKEMIAKKGLELRYTPPAAPLHVIADKGRTEQILVNLVGNSAKFTKSGSITIELVPDAAFVRLRVIDTGVGISEHNQTLLFRKFQQAGEDMLARDVSQSTGLGLYICKLIVGNMGGEIGLEYSELGKGSSFYFTLPIASSDSSQ